MASQISKIFCTFTPASLRDINNDYFTPVSIGVLNRFVPLVSSKGTSFFNPFVSW